MDSLWTVGIILFLLLLNGLFVAAEFALIGAPRPAIEALAEKGNQAARLVRDILFITGIPLGASSDELARLFRRSPHTRYPVYRETIDQIVGMLHVQDLFARIVDGRPVSLADVRKAPFVPESASLNQVLEAMRKERTQLCVVLDEYGGTEGIITLTDLFHEVAGKFPEGAVHQGEIFYDRDGRLRVAGTARLEEVGETLKIPLRHEEVDTVSGLVLSLVGSSPQVGDRVEYQDLSFEVQEVEGRGVRWCVVTRDPKPRLGESPDESAAAW